MQNHLMKRGFAWALGILGFLALTWAAPAGAATVSYTLYVESGSLVIHGAGGSTLSAWGYTTVNGGAPQFPAPQLEADEGDSVNITVVNNHNKTHNLVVKGQSDSDTTSISPGGSHTYSFTAGSGGTYIYRDTVNEVNRVMGLYGAFVVRPAQNGRVWSSGPTYDLERTWVVGDMDKPRWNDVAGSGGNVNTSVYRPNYFVMNGQGGEDAMIDPNTRMIGSVGDVMLVRIANGGLLDQSLHFHGGHILILSEDGAPLTYFREATTINVKAGSSADVLYEMIQPGEYPMHVHTAQMETANGVYLNGTATMIDIQ